MASDKFVSRGGEKLQDAIDKFKIDVKDKVVLDVGSSTGGFVDCLLQNGAQKVFALDTAYGELAWKLRNDPRVVVMERTNILHLQHLPGQNTPGVGFDSPGVSKVDLVTIDAGWTKIELILPIISNFLKTNGVVIALLKPHYEGNKKDLVKGVLPKEFVNIVKNEVFLKIKQIRWEIDKEMKSPILGGAGNIEFLLLCKAKKKAGF